MEQNRRCGVLLHITSLNAREGIGTLGQPAFDFIDALERAGVSVWQMLPVGPTGGGDSPYQSASTFAGNPLLIDLMQLRKDGLLDLPPALVPDGPVDFPRVKKAKHMMLERAFKCAYERLEPEVEAFRQRNAWVDDYALFEALREHFDGAPLAQWPDRAARLREEQALSHYRTLLCERVNYHAFVQYLFDRQWEKLKFYAGVHGVSLFGDLPIYVAADSADVWANPGLFKLDEARRPLKVAGVPPDYFAKDGQLWGNPIYDWKAHKRTGYQWWIKRMRGVAARFDIVRIDHFIGFVNYYSVDYGAPNARQGKWHNGPGEALFRAVRKALPDLKIVAEDLGVVNPRVNALRKRFGFPGMRVLQFGFDGHANNGHLPANYKKNAVAYTGTHDNDTSLGWWTHASPKERKAAQKALGLGPDDDAVAGMIRAVMKSRARMCVIPMQDLLALDSRARMNTPGTPTGNWRWRMPPDALGDALQARMRALALESERGIMP